MNVTDFFDLRKTRADRLLSSANYPWEALDMMKEYILRIGRTLDRSVYCETRRGIWIAKNAEVSEAAKLCAPLIIGEGSKILGRTALSGGAIIGNEVFVGSGSEIKCSVIFDGARINRNNYISDSIVGHLAHFGAGAIVSSRASGLGGIVYTLGKDSKRCERARLGAVIGDGADIGCSSVLCAGTVVERGARISPLTRARGFISGEAKYRGEQILLSDIL